MRIKYEVYNKILYSAKPSPVETGGFLGGKGSLISNVVIDNKNKSYGKYQPDTALLNRTMEAWENDGIDFLGIYHSHYPSNIFLSTGDRTYIDEIMKSVGNRYKALYFPVVILNKEMYVYKAEYRNSKTIITREQLIFE